MATPTTFEDGNDGACNVVHCTLREALSFPIQTINLLPGTYELTMQQPLILSGVRTINGAGATIDGNGASRVLFLQETTNATINDVTITGGNATGNTPQGGGIYVQNPSTLQLNRSTVAGNRADTQGGGIFTESSGLVEIIDSTISGNAAGPVAGGGQGARHLRRRGSQRHKRQTGQRDRQRQPDPWSPRLRCRDCRAWCAGAESIRRSPVTWVPTAASM